jgi:hypothetical protein
MKSEEMSAFVLDHNIEAISFSTGGLDTNESVLAALREKYGQPAAIHTTPMQNAFGAQFQAIVAIWHVGDITVTYEAGNLDMTSGSVEIATSQGEAALAEIAQARKRNDLRPKF